MEFDVVVIGSGPGGYTAAIRLGHLGQKVLLVEKFKTGGVCLNWGCIPTKALLHAAETIDSFKHSSVMGIEAPAPNLDFDKLQAWKQKIVDQLAKGLEMLFKGNKVEYMKGEAFVNSPDTIFITKIDGEKIEVKTKNIILATGSTPVSLPHIKADNEKIFMAEDALSFDKIPSSLLIIGAGATGLEMGTVYSRFGTKVTVVELMPQIMPGNDTEMANMLARSIQRSGIDILTESTVKELKDNEAVITLKDGSEKIVPFEKVLLGVGRKPVTDSFKELNLKLSPKGFVQVDNKLRTSIPTVYAIGDVNGVPLLAHKAMREGVVASEVIAGMDTVYEPKSVPGCVFTFPNLASVGLSEEQAKAEGYEIEIGKFPFRASGRAMILGSVDGQIKVIGDKKTGKLIGMHILGPESSSLIGEGILAIENGLKVEDIGQAIHPHPTLSEVVMEGAESLHKRAIHILNK